MVTFKKITNDDIYAVLEEIKQHVIETNGKVKTTRWIATTALTFTVAIIFKLLI